MVLNDEQLHELESREVRPMWYVYFVLAWASTTLFLILWFLVPNLATTWTYLMLGSWLVEYWGYKATKNKQPIPEDHGRHMSPG